MRKGLPTGLLVLLVAAACGAPTPATSPDPGIRIVERDTITFLTLNIWHNQGDWPARQEALTEGLRALDADVICMQEVLQEPGLPNQAEAFARALDYRTHFVSWDSAGSPKRYGNAILSRLPVVETGERLLDPPDDYRAVAHARVTAGEDTVDIYCTHLHHTAEGADMRRTQVLDALDFIDLTRGSGPVIFAGDFNASTSAPELQPVRDRFADAYRVVLGDTAAEVTTLNTELGHRFERIDHVFFRSGLQVDLVPLAADIVLDEQTAEGVWPSDHFGLLVPLSLQIRQQLPRRGPRTVR